MICVTVIDCFISILFINSFIRNIFVMFCGDLMLWFYHKHTHSRLSILFCFRMLCFASRRKCVTITILNHFPHLRIYADKTDKVEKTIIDLYVPIESKKKKQKKNDEEVLFLPSDISLVNIMRNIFCLCNQNRTKNQDVW